jgi:hypothetical protein
MPKEVYMEDVHDISLKAMDVIEGELKKFDVTLSDFEQDAIYVTMSEAIEMVMKHPDYRNHN